MTKQSRVPIHEDFASSGVLSALRRQEHWVNVRFPKLLASADMGMDLFDCNVTVPASVRSGLRTMRTFRRARVVLDSVLDETALPPLPEEPAGECDDVDRVMLMNMVRMSYGEMLESATRLRASGHCTCDELPVHPNSLRVFPRLMMDSYLIACWTSAHAEWLDTLVATDGLARELCLTENELSVPTAQMHMVPYAVSTLPDFGALLERRTVCKTVSSSASAMAALLTRCTNAGSRG